MKQKKESIQGWELDELERAIVRIWEEADYNYSCSQCGYGQEVPDFVADEFAAYE